MSEQPFKCPRCGGQIPAGSGASLCPRCAAALLQAEPTEFTEDAGPHGTKVLKQQPPAPSELAAKFPQLEIIELLGRGGMGAVYKARQKQLDRFVALKILPPGVTDDPTFSQRFAREAKALAQLNHPHIVTLFEFGQADGLYYFLMELVDGVNLRQVQRAGRLTPEQALAIVPQICDALQYAHQRGIVHRDIKPENILVNREGRVKIADFGVAKLMERDSVSRSTPGSGETEGTSQEIPTGQAAASRMPPPQSMTDAGKVMGTPHYMAPEQMDRPREVDHRADIYSLGVVFYEMLTGELPQGKFALPSRKVQLDVRIDEIVLRALEKNPELRFQEASVFKTQVESVAIQTDPSRIANSQSTPRASEAEYRVRSGGIVLVGQRDGKAAIVWRGVFNAFFAILGVGVITAVVLSPLLPGLSRATLFLVPLLALFIIAGGVIIGLRTSPAKLMPLDSGSRAREKDERSATASRWGKTCAKYGLLLLLVLTGLAIVLRVGPFAPIDPSRLADSPSELRRATTDRVIAAGLSKPLSPWAWQEVGRRNIGREEAGRILQGLTYWLQMDPAAFIEPQPLHWVHGLLTKLADERLVSEEQILSFLVALHGDLRGEPAVRVPEGEPSLSVRLQCRYPWRRDVMGFVMLNEIQSATLEDKPLVLQPNHGRSWLMDEVEQTFDLPPLPPGTYRLNIEVLSALAPKDDVEGMNADAPASNWPSTAGRWTRGFSMDLIVYPRAATVVSLTTDPALDPVRDGRLTLKRAVVRRTGERIEMAIEFTADRVPVDLSFDVAFRLGDQSIPGRPLWLYRKSERSTTFSGFDQRITLPELDSDVREVDLILTPNPAHLKSVAGVNEVWGGTIAFRAVLLRRLDVPQSGVAPRFTDPRGEDYRITLPSGESFAVPTRAE